MLIYLKIWNAVLNFEGRKEENVWEKIDSKVLFLLGEFPGFVPISLCLKYLRDL